MKIIRSHEFFGWHLFSAEEAVEFGLEKACVLNNISNFKSSGFSSFEEFFPYIESKKLRKILKELIKEGKIIESEVKDE